MNLLNRYIPYRNLSLTHNTWNSWKIFNIVKEDGDQLLINAHLSGYKNAITTFWIYKDNFTFKTMKECNHFIKEYEYHLPKDDVICYNTLEYYTEECLPNSIADHRCYVDYYDCIELPTKFEVVFVVTVNNPTGWYKCKRIFSTYELAEQYIKNHKTSMEGYDWEHSYVLEKYGINKEDIY